MIINAPNNSNKSNMGGQFGLIENFPGEFELFLGQHD